MIAEAFNKLKKQIIKPTEVENEWIQYPSEPRIQSTVDEGAHLTNIERKVHVFHSIKQLNK